MGSNDSNTLSPCMHTFRSALLKGHSMYAWTTSQYVNMLHLKLAADIREAHKTLSELYSPIFMARDAVDGIRNRKMTFDSC